MRDETVRTFVERYRIDAAQSERVAALAERFFAAASPTPGEEAVRHLRWAARLHEIGWTVSHTSFHKHSGYILAHADMPGFTAQEQDRLGALALGCRGGLRKIEGRLGDPRFRAQVLALRLAVLFLHARRSVALDAFDLRVGERVQLALPADWLEAHPLTAQLLDEECEAWRECGIDMKVSPR
jgi:exopolyphosphatase/guanosine-5'-triphosphate,3'-diphosphate pyrophosphatase